MESKNEKFLVDRGEVLRLIGATYADFYPDKKAPTPEEIAVLNFAKEVFKRVRALDAQKIEGIDFTNGGRTPQEVVERCQFKEEGEPK